MLEATTAGGKRGMLGRRESAQTRFQFWPKIPVDRSNDENAKPTGQNRHEAKGKRREAKKHKKQKPSNVKWMAFSPCILENCHPSRFAHQPKKASLSSFWNRSQ
jgi:hypothetical protein